MTAPPQTPDSPDYRAALRTLMVATIVDRAHWHYLAFRPEPVPPTWHVGQPVTADCSKGVQFLCRWAGVPHDPMNQGWGPFGNSSTLAACLHHALGPSDLEIGDIVTVGPGGRTHAAMVKQTGTDPVMWSFGHRAAPNSYPLSADRRWPKQYLRLPLPVFVPTPEDVLRAMTGYWAWLQWTLGESHWQPYRGFDRTVRPNVRRLIPAGWWRERTRYLANRERGNVQSPATP